MATHATPTEPELILLSESPYDTPDPHRALIDPEGLSAIGGDLSTQRLIHLYSKGFFPWYSDPDPILWWHPKRRCVLQPDAFHTSRSLKKAIKSQDWHFCVNTSFQAVIQHCAELRRYKEGTWISEAIQHAYYELHQQGYAHSIEIWQDNQLAGGFYGVAMGNVFFGESMFSLKPNASKVALKTFCTLAQQYQINLIDCQVPSEHLLSLGANLISRTHFVKRLHELIPTPVKNTNITDTKGFPIHQLESS